MIASLPAAGFALMLVAGAALSWILAAEVKASARPDIRFAAVLFAALGFAGLLAALAPQFDSMAGAACLLVAPLATIALALAALSAFVRAPSRLAATSALMLGCIAGLLSAVTGLALPSFASLTAGVIVMLIVAPAGLRESKFASLRVLVAGFAFFGGGLCLLSDARSAPELFFATGLLGLTLGIRALGLSAQRGSKAAVEEKRGLAASLPIGPFR